MPARVGDADLEPLLRGRPKPSALEPRRDAAGAPRCRHDEVRRERLLRAAVDTAQDPHAGDVRAVAAGREADGVAAVDQRDVRQRADAAPDVALDERPAGEDRAGAGGGASELVAAQHDAHLVQDVAGRRPARDQLVVEAGQQPVHARLPEREQRVRVAALRHRPAAAQARRQLVVVDHRDALVSVGERARREQPGDAAAEHHRVFTDPFMSPISLIARSDATLAGADVEPPGEFLSSSCRVRRPLAALGAVDLAVPEPVRRRGRCRARGGPR